VGDPHRRHAITWQTIFNPELGLRDHAAELARPARRDTVWLGERGWALAVMVFADVWKTAPFMALLLLAGLQVIPDDVYEAAKVDGRRRCSGSGDHAAAAQARAILVALIFRTLDALRIFDLPVRPHQGALGTTTLSLISYETFQTNEYWPRLGTRES
jgi:multiple sugar transport system permease protein